MILKRDYALYDPSGPTIGRLHSSLHRSMPPLVNRLGRTEGDCPKKAEHIDKILAQRKEARHEANA